MSEIVCGIHDLKPLFDEGYVELETIDGESVHIDTSSDPDVADSETVNEAISYLLEDNE